MTIWKIGIITIVVTGITQTALATSLIYVPVNPSFGGNPMNGSYLLSEAQVQNTHTAPVTASTSRNNSLVTNFENSLTASVLSMLAGQIASASFGNGSITTGIPYSFNGYSIVVNDAGNSYQVSITDSFGAQTTMTVGKSSIPAATGTTPP